jgi:glycosyltransferase involved in cell wall biosynthesis
VNAWALVTGDFVKTGGMDVANWALAHYLARQGHEVHLVAHRIDPGLLDAGNVRFHEVPKRLNSYYLGRRALDRAGRRVAADVSARGGHVVVNGGNCLWGDINWVHYVHAAYTPEVGTGRVRRWVNAWKRRVFLAEEREAVSIARVVITASRTSRKHVIEHLNVPGERVQAVYYGVDPEGVHPGNSADRAATRAAVGWPVDTPVALFVGALGDRRKGFDTVFDAWRQLAGLGAGMLRLAVVGRGAEAAAWQERVAKAGLAERITFLGFRNDVPQLVRAADVLVAPARYEPYGLSVHEAMCSGTPAIASMCSGVSEKYPGELRDLLLQDEENSCELAERVVRWLTHRGRYRGVMLGVSQTLRQWTWDHMAEAMVRTIEGTQSGGGKVLRLSA